MTKRTYRMTKRAESREETRARIVDAAIALHEEVGPKDTTISAIADRAGVQRLTVYRHFPDDETLLQACSSGWLAGHPPPAPESLIGAGAQVCRDGLAALYAYYSGTSRMWTSILRDEGEVEALRGPLGGYRDYLDRYAAGLHDALVSGGRADRAARFTLRHAVELSTWASLSACGLSDADKADLVMGWLAGSGLPAAKPPSRGM
jgi:AcrR family transcriptional regulator